MPKKEKLSAARGRGILAEMCQADFADWKPEVAVLPIGSTEVHGLHLPYGNDYLTADALARRATLAANAAGARVIMLPVIPYGVDSNLLAFPYTIHVRPSTIMTLANDILESLRHHGVCKLLIANYHYGNTSTLQTIYRELYGRAFIACIDCWRIAADVSLELMETAENDHAGEEETSISLSLFPEWVRMDAAAPTVTNKHRLPLLVRYSGCFSRPWEHFTQNGGVGDPTKASAAKGQAITEAIIARFKDILLELSNAPYDASFPFIKPAPDK